MITWEVRLIPSNNQFETSTCCKGIIAYLLFTKFLSPNVRPRYLKASKAEKQTILDEFTYATGYHRKHATRVLKDQRQVQNRLKGKTKTCKTRYGGEVVPPLEQIWEIYGQICSKRLQPILPEVIKVLERCQEIELSKDTKELLLKISSASIDRCLRSVRCNRHTV